MVTERTAVHGHAFHPLWDVIENRGPIIARKPLRAPTGPPELKIRVSQIFFFG